MAVAAAPARSRNRRGEGARLREEIVQAASALLEQTGRDDAITLRAVARDAGITAPSIYAHFADADEIRAAVVERTFAELATALQPASGRRRRPVPALYAVCQAYLDFAAEHPDLYRVLFQRHHPATAASAVTHDDVSTMVGADAFGVLLGVVQACIAHGDSGETSAQAAAVRVWVALHGMATLRASLPWFPWPPRDNQLRELIPRLVDLTSRPAKAR